MRRSSAPALSVRALVAVALVLGACGSDGDGDGAGDEAIDLGFPVLSTDDLDNGHIQIPDAVTDEAGLFAYLADGVVDYDQVPPAGGDHAPVWLNCGFYDEVQPDELVVHALEHGAVWFAHGGGLSADELDELRRLGRELTEDRAIVSPHPDVADGEVWAVAWGHRYGPTTADDPNLATFTEAFEDNRDAPEPNVTCQSGVGDHEPL